MRIVFDAAARDDLDRIFEWIEHDNPPAARAVIARIEARIAQLASPVLAYMGRPGLDPGTRELVVPPHVIVYEVFDDRREIVVLAIFHGAQDRQTK